MTKPWHETLPGVWCIDVYHPTPHRTCCFLLTDGARGALIDCGAKNGIDHITRAVAAAGLKPEQIEWVIITHAHLDHAGAAGQLLQIFPNAVLGAHHEALVHLINPEKKLLPAVQTVFGMQHFNAQYAGLLAVEESRTHKLNDDDIITAGGRQLQVLYTPGHAWHHISLHDQENSIFYAGDAYGISYLPAGDGGRFIVPVMPPSHFEPNVAADSLRKLQALNASKVALTHFGIIENSPAHADAQLATLEEWVHVARDIYQQKPGNFTPLFADYLKEWYKKAATRYGIDSKEAATWHQYDTVLTSKGFAYWLNKIHSQQ